MEDDKIIRLFWKRDQRAIRETEASYGARLFRLASGILRNHEDAEESVNDTYLKAWNSIPPQKPRYFFAYLAKICRNQSLGMLDWKNAAKRRAVIVELTAEMEQCIPAPYVESRAESGEIGRLLGDFLKNLSEQKRLIFMRRYWYADSIHEIADRYCISESSVKITLHRTRIKLRSYLEKEGIAL